MFYIYYKFFYTLIFKIMCLFVVPFFNYTILLYNAATCSQQHYIYIIIYLLLYHKISIDKYETFFKT